MSYNNITYFSNALGKQSNALVYVPDNPDNAPFRVVYQLHGYSDDATMWMWRSNISRYAEDRGLMIVCPDGGKGFYTNSYLTDEYYEDHILETVEFIDKVFNTSKKREDRFIGGLSMGGYGAMKIGLKYNDKFSSIAAHSAVMDIKDFYEMRDRDNDVPGRKRLDSIFGGSPENIKEEDDIFYLAKKYGNRIRIHFDCGEEDFLFAENEALHKFMTENKINHIYETHPGVHCWDYWDAHVPAALDFHLNV